MTEFLNEENEVEMEQVTTPVVESENENTDASATPIAEAETAPAKKTIDPLKRFNELTEDRQNSVNEIVNGVLDQIRLESGEIDLGLLLGVLDKLNTEKKSAREADKELQKIRKEQEKQEAAARGEELKKKVKVGDRIDYYMSTQKVTVLDAEVIKVTDKSARIEVTADTRVLYKGTEHKAGDIVSLKLGTKSVAFGKILKWVDPKAAASAEAEATSEEAVEADSEAIENIA